MSGHDDTSAVGIAAPAANLPSSILHPPSSIPPAVPRALALVLLAGVFFLASSLPIWHLDTWSHWKYGEWIWQNGRLPEREPFSPYSEPTPLVDTWWLSQVVCYLVYARAGMEGIALFYGLVQVAKTALLLIAFRRMSGSLLLAVVAVVLVEVGLWEFFGNFRPQVFAEVCWAALLAVVSRSGCAGQAEPNGVRHSRTYWLAAVPICVGLWANLHGSFPLAFVLLGVLLAGRFLEQAWALRNPVAALREGDVQRLALALALALAAACVNPYGPKLLTAALNFGNMPVLQHVTEWQPMTPLERLSSVALVGSVVLTLATVRLSPRRFGLAEIALLLMFALSAWYALRMVPWWMTLCPFLLLPHWAAILERVTGGRHAVIPSRRHPVITGVGVVAAVVLLLVSGPGRAVLRGEPRPVEQQVTAVTPIGPSAAIKDWLGRDGQQPLRMYASPHWGDYLLWDLPPAAYIYRYSHWNCYSPRRMEDATRLMLLGGPPNDWRGIIDRYRLNALALRGDGRSSLLFEHLLAEENRPGAEWQIIYKGSPMGPAENARPAGIVAVRRVDPFVTTLANAQAAQGCVGGLGMAPLAGQWGILTHLPWFWKEAQRQQETE